ncbi:MAG: UvrD-helicase domain-containing protein [Bacteroidetes bacterium]|nr:UvrD-helicase domain-containing protein [Bacteroidota bacterium]
MKKPLKILNASAGSGKTHQLVLEYLTILLGEDYSIPKYKSIVAMTFTNKASLEMKNRIITTLEGIVDYNGTNVKISNMLSGLVKNIGVKQTDIQKRAKKALGQILHGYEDFHVSTIDKFNLRLIRSFSKDLDLPGEFEVVLNESQIIEDVVDLLMSKLGQANNEDLTNLMTLYARTNLEDGQSWNFKQQLVEFASVLSSERYQDIVEKLLAMSLTDNDFNLLRAEIRQLESDFISEANDFGNFAISLGLTPNNTPGAATAVNSFESLSQLESFPAAKKTGGLFTDTILNNARDRSGNKQFSEALANRILALNNSFLLAYSRHQLLIKFRSNFFNMALLQFIAKSLTETKENEQIIRISEFNKLISSLVGEEDAPYIYERLGTHLEHFLLDEFQDTSRLQWLNLIPLVHESLGNARRNLIVGDAKQSIYRFNNGLAEQFVSLPKIYNPEKDAKIERVSNFFNEQGLKENLENNYRSAKEIVEFNNDLFELLKEQLHANHIDFYDSIEQNVVSNLDGFVQIISMQSDPDLEVLVIPIIECIEQCVSDGFKMGDICVLTPTNVLGNGIANKLTEYKIPVVSQDSLLIAYDAKIQLILSYLKRRERPTNETETKRFAELFLRLSGETTDKYLTYFETKVYPNGNSKRFFNDEKFLVEFFGSSEQFFSTYESLYDLVLKFFNMMKWEETKDPYLHHFVDVVFDYQSNKQSDIKFFLDYFSENKKNIALQMPETDSAVKIMTIHKSKGLEFPVVILPKLDLSIKIHTQAKFLIEARDKILYGNLSKNSSLVEIANFTERELSLTFLDKLNLCYVALTRPVQRLYAFNYFKKDNLGALIHERIERNFPCEMTENGELLLQLGTEQKIQREEKSQLEEFYIPQELNQRLWYPDVVFRKISDTDKELIIKEQRFGNYFHALMARCDSKSTIETNLAELIRNGEIDPEFQVELMEKANEFFNQSEFLFEGVEEIINEQLILIPNSTDKRPDKILIKKDELIVFDFKTGKKSDRHQPQLMGYHDALIKMFDKPIKLFLYYTETSSLLSV